jgi:hypothetical protein
MIQAMSGRVGVIKATSLNDEDIKALPYPEYASSSAIPKADEIVMSDALEYYSAPRRQDVHQRLYRENITIPELHQYADVFCKGFNSYAGQNGRGFALSRIISSGQYYVLQIEQKDIENPVYEECDDISGCINTLTPIHSSQNHSTHIQKIMKVYGKGVLLLIKPKLRRFWLQSIALRDSDDIFADNIMMLQSHV